VQSDGADRECGQFLGQLGDLGIIDRHIAGHPAAGDALEAIGDLDGLQILSKPLTSAA